LDWSQDRRRTWSCRGHRDGARSRLDRFGRRVDLWNRWLLWCKLGARGLQLSIASQFTKVFPGCTIASASRWTVSKANREETVDIFGVLSFFCSDEGVLWPPLCCECGEPPTGDVAHATSIVWLGHGKTDRMRPPAVCVGHRESPRFLCVVSVVGKEFGWAHVFSASEQFLAALKSLNVSRFPPPPPWAVFPAKNPATSWNQGIEGFFLAEIWRPHWDRLSGEERRVVLQRWPMPVAWQDCHPWQSLLQDTLRR
jgi:hypothetical protein